MPRPRTQADIDYRRRYVLDDRQAEADARHTANRKPYKADRRKHARNKARKYGLTLRQIEAIGLDLYPDIREALDGTH